MPELLKLKVTAGDLAGRYVGPIFHELAVTSDLLTNPPVVDNRAGLAFYIQADAATRYFPPAAHHLQLQLKRSFGLETELL
ncbi:MAG TPA: hypothetical protein VGM02_01320 [Acidobacteriaceae bacterium]|jgi:hypothetical protein